MGLSVFVSRRERMPSSPLILLWLTDPQDLQAKHPPQLGTPLRTGSLNWDVFLSQNRTNPSGNRCTNTVVSIVP
jgi:hypothetical protein